MRVSHDIRRCIVFFGWGPESSRDFFGTGFLLGYDGHSWLVTARHVAKDIGRDPFYVWGNSKKPQHFDNAVWTYHRDKSVDIAVAAFGSKWKRGKRDASAIPSVSFLPQDALLTEDERPLYDIGVGDFAYVIGLFHLLPGQKRFLPVVHTGHIALLPENERIPVEWADGSHHEVEGYIVQAPTLDALSGAPVFVRRTVFLNPQDGIRPAAGGDMALLGVWIAAWSGKSAIKIGRAPSKIVPVGMGIVVPAERIVETIKAHVAKHVRSTRAARAGRRAEDD